MDKGRIAGEGGVSEEHIEYPILDTAEERTRPRLVSLLFADWASRTADGKVALGGVFDSVVLRGDQPKNATFYVYIRLAEAYRDLIHMVLYAPDGQPQGDLTIDPGELQPDPDQFNFIQFISRLTFHLPDTGVWWFVVTYQGASLGEAPLIVSLTDDAHADPNHVSVCTGAEDMAGRAKSAT